MPLKSACPNWVPEECRYAKSACPNLDPGTRRVPVQIWSIGSEPVPARCLFSRRHSSAGRRLFKVERVGQRGRARSSPPGLCLSNVEQRDRRGDAPPRGNPPPGAELNDPAAAVATTRTSVSSPSRRASPSSVTRARWKLASARNMRRTPTFSLQIPSDRVLRCSSPADQSKCPFKLLRVRCAQKPKSPGSCGCVGCWAGRWWAVALPSRSRRPAPTLTHDSGGD